MRDVEIPKWLKGLPLAPEFRPTDTEFADPIAYISKIEKEAGAFGICKVIPPLPKPSKKYVLNNLNKSLSKCPELGLDVNVCSTSQRTDNGGKGNNSGEVRAVFTTRHQELGNSGKKAKRLDGSQTLVAHKQVWQSGEAYTIEQFEAKAKNFAKSQLGIIKDVSSLVIEAMFWKAASEKPIYVEYANDVPGSGFGEPEGLFKYFHRRRRRRKRGTFDRNRQDSSSCKDDQVDIVNCIGVDADSCSKNNNDLCDETSRDRRKCSTACNDVEGTAGWKLSNSPWNLQTIARSPGSLTRFMPDDIPGVTSPMVYIGMLFSWFAWHVEDHELHSLNFLHVGSPKTWYAVPGDYALEFEEVIRHHAYGGNTDSLAALTLLGEKTTLLSPEVMVESGIPCCRLVQNPGEFVVTFPRAYHVGFSHGFNCGEAANLSTPQWLAVAKEAAVRRAAMNFLPMLSHQQLLYLLTMSFVTRVPRSLLPGVRSSRRRDRQKEERERLVKKAFIEDIVKENKLLTSLLQKSSSYRVVEWDLESLPSSFKGTELGNNNKAVAPTSPENVSGKAKLDLCTEMSLYMDKVHDIREDDDDDDLLCDFQVDSGSLPCVSCGILGFPFISVVQPSEIASRDLQLEDHNATQNSRALKCVESHAPVDFNCIVNASDRDKLHPVLRNILDDRGEASSSAQSRESTCSVAEVQFPVTEDSSALKREAASAEVQKRWNRLNRFSRPRIFCLDHATQTEELLRSRGGANVLVICHSDFRKIKAHVSVVAEEIGTPFSSEEIPFVNAAHEDLNLIDLSTQNDEQDECTEDWTAKLHVNLQHYMKLRKKIPSLKVQHALRLDGLFSITNQSSNGLTLTWQSRKSRSKRCSKYLVQRKPSVSIQMEKLESRIEKSDSPVASKEDQIQIDKSESSEDCRVAGKGNIVIQYSRRRHKSKPCVSTGVEASAGPNLHFSLELSGTGGDHPDRKTSIMSGTSPRLVASSRDDPLQLDSQILPPADDNHENGLPSLYAGSFAAGAPAVRNTETETEAETGGSELKELTMDDTVSKLTSHIPQVPQEIKALEVDSGKNQTGVFINSAGSTETAGQTSDNCETAGFNPIRNETRVANSIVPLVADDLNIGSNKHPNGDVLMDKASDASSSSMSSVDSPSPESRDEETGKTEKDHQRLDSELMDHSSSYNKGLQEIQTTDGDCQNKAVSEDVKVPKETNSSEDSESEVEKCSLVEKIDLDDSGLIISSPKTSVKSRRKRKRESDLLAEAQISSNDFIRSPCESLRPRTRKDAVINENDCKKPVEVKKVRKRADDLVVPHKDAKQQKKGSLRCDIESCRMRFHSKAELHLHKRNRCTYKGCGKEFSAHKNLVLHQCVHSDDRPLKCSWKGCTMTFKWAWARTEHLRVHTGERPYKCKVNGCGRTFRFVSDYSRHRRKTGHYVD